MKDIDICRTVKLTIIFLSCHGPNDLTLGYVSNRLSSWGNYDVKARSVKYTFFQPPNLLFTFYSSVSDYFHTFDPDFWVL